MKSQNKKNIIFRSSENDRLCQVERVVLEQWDRVQWPLELVRWCVENGHGVPDALATGAIGSPPSLLPILDVPPGVDDRGVQFVGE